MKIDDHPVEFPRINDSLHSKVNRYVYLPAKIRNEKPGEFSALIKYDLEQQHSIIHDFGDHIEIDEAVFAHGASAQVEDEGYLMLFAYNKRENNSEFIILNAQNFNAPPEARIPLPRRVPHGLHGMWMPGAW